MRCRFCLVGILALAVGSAFGELRPRKDFVLTETEAIGLMPPEVVSAGNALKAWWSPDGRYLLILRQRDNLTPENAKALVLGDRQARPEPTQELIMWNARTRLSSVVLTLAANAGAVAEVDWLPGSPVALVRREVATVMNMDSGQPWRDSELYLFSALTGRYRTVLKPSSNERMMISVSPTRARSVVRVSPLFPAKRPGDAPEPAGPAESYVLIGPNGIEQQPVPSGSTSSDMRWAADGATCYAGQLVRSADRTASKATWRVLDFGVGAIKDVSDPQFYRPLAAKQPEPGPAASSTKLTLSQISTEVGTLWLSSSFQSEFSAVVVSADATAVEMSPSLDSIYYVSQGIGYVRSLVRMPKDLFLKALEAADRAVAMSNAKQAAVALIMYSADNDDKLPIKEADILATLFPYVKNGEILRGFVYTFEGGDISKIANPAETMLGYIPGPGGRAVAYADGHVQWQAGS